MNDQLKPLYYNPIEPTSFSWRRPLRDQLRSASNEQVQEWLDSQLTYSLHRPARRRFTRNKIYASGPGQMAQADLADMKNIGDKNDNKSYLLVYIDCFSKYAHVEAVSNKGQREVTSAFRRIFQRTLPCTRLQCDKGKEFTNASMKQLAKDLHFQIYFTHNKDIKCAIAERFVRTIKSKIWKYITSRGSSRYVDALTDIVSSYNMSFHRSIGMAPAEVNDANRASVHKRLYGYSDEREMMLTRERAAFEDQKLPIGGLVRKRYELSVMEKGFLPNWSDKVYRIIQFIKGFPKSMYKIADELGRPLKQRFYKEDLQLIPEDPPFRIAQVLKRDRKKRRALVRWTNHEPEFDKWIPESQIAQLS